MATRSDPIGERRRGRLKTMIPKSCFPLCCCVGPIMCLVGCGSGAPTTPTFPVKGTVVWKSGEPLKEGGIQLGSMTSPVISTGNIVNGEFSVFTVIDNQRVPGATLGEHAIHVSLPQ